MCGRPWQHFDFTFSMLNLMVLTKLSKKSADDASSMKMHSLNGSKRGTITMKITNEKQGSAVNPAKSDERSQDMDLTMNIAVETEAKKENVQTGKNALLIRAKTKLPKSIKGAIKKMGSVWLEVHQAYAIPLSQRDAILQLLEPWKAYVNYSETYIDLSLFSPAGKVKNNQETRISILQEQIYHESMQLMCDIRSYDLRLSESDFNEKPAQDGKTTSQVQIETVFYERRQNILDKQRELDSLTSSVTKMGHDDNPFVLDKIGLWHVSEEGKTWISSPIHVTARVRDEHGLNHGKLLEFDDADGVHHTWAMPMEMLAGDCSEFRSTLMNAGLEISTSFKARQWLADYVQRFIPSCTARCVSRTGWHKKGFVLPDTNIGDLGQEKVLIQGKTCNFRGYCVAGTLLDWQSAVADRSVGNSRLIFAISVGFAGPLLHLMEAEPGGFHLCSHSSSGKTTALRAAASIYGNKEFMRKWKATVNGLETIAFQHNDTLLCLDEMGEMNAFDLGDAAYMLANGSGKNRARPDGGLREPLTWKLLFLSSGETGLAAHMEQAGKKAKAGQEIRLAEIPADTGKSGLFEELHGFTNGSIFADELSKNSQKYYGTAGREFLKRLTQDIEEAKVFIRKTMDEFLAAAIPEGASGQIHRVAGRFALVAAAGELAIHYDITRVLGKDGIASIGWDEGTARQAVLKCFQDWMEAFGGPGLQEKTQLLADVRYFLEQHGESRFTDWYANDPDALPSGSRTYNRAGFRRHTDEGTEFYIFPETFKRDICKGRDEKFVKQILYDHGLLKKDSQGKFTCAAKPASETKSRRFYVFFATSNEGEP
jgi:uncharacterized protein (DUF927 family)